jgi:hypothetical protein
MEELFFEVGLNGGTLILNTKGEIDQDHMVITIPIPPDLDLEVNKLVGRARIRTEGNYNEEHFDILINKYWRNGDLLELDRNDFDPKWQGDSSFINKYILNMKKELVSRLFLEPTSNYYSTIPSFDIRLSFNAFTNSRKNILLKDETNFINGLSINSPTGGAYTTPAVGDISPQIFDPSTPSGTYTFTFNVTDNGIYTIVFLSDSILCEFDETPNLKSNKLTLIYDDTSPVIPSAPDDAVTVSNLDNTITDYHDAKLTLAFKESSDFSDLTPRDKLRYSFQVEFPAGFTYPIPYQGYIDVPYQSSYTWDFDEMPLDLQNLLKFNNDLMFNVSVHDLAYNYSNYIPGNQTYTGPSTP